MTEVSFIEKKTHTHTQADIRQSRKVEAWGKVAKSKAKKSQSIWRAGKPTTALKTFFTPRKNSPRKKCKMIASSTAGYTKSRCTDRRENVR